jgi:hypothetical protein|nr:MAG TPA: hypothetical protein [Caudoviricetes sp.]
MSKKIEVVSAHLGLLVEHYHKLDEPNRSASFQSAKEKLETEFGATDLPDDIDSLKALKGIGPSTINEVKEVLATGTSKRLEELKTKIATTGEDIDPNALKDQLKGLLA